MSGSKENHGWAESHKRPCHPPRTSRSGKFSGSGKFKGCDVEPGLQPGYCCLMTDFIQDDYHSPLRSRSYRSGGTTQQIASAPINDFTCVLKERNSEDLCAMAPDLLRWGNDLISEPADHVLLPIRAIYMILRSFLLIYRSVLLIITTRNRANLLVAPNRDLVKSKRKGRQDDSKRLIRNL